MDKRRISALVIEIFIGTVFWIGAAASACTPALAGAASLGAGEDGPSLRSLRLSGP